MKGVSVEDLAKEIVAAYFFASQQYSFNATDFRDFNAQKNRIVYKVVNAKEYADQLPTGWIIFLSPLIVLTIYLISSTPIFVEVGKSNASSVDEGMM